MAFVREGLGGAIGGFYWGELCPFSFVCSPLLSISIVLLKFVTFIARFLAAALANSARFNQAYVK